MDGSIAGCSSNVEIGGCDSDVENQSGGCSLYEAFEVPLETSDDSVCQSAEESLQRAFQKYRGKKQEELRANAEKEMANQRERRDPARMAVLRTKFLERATTYMGTPYARKFHRPDSPAFSADLYLDCCGLVRRVLKDLKEEFGFSIGPWNQAYMFDTLPVVVSGPAEMEPGDLVFISGTYNNPKAKRQHHDMVHVEIWAGDGEKTIGARWHSGSVEVHDSYKFEAKSYHDMQYFFRSINTWLAGECKSHCPEHPWQIRKFNPSKHSIFTLEHQEEGEAAYSLLDQDLAEQGQGPSDQVPKEATKKNLKLGRSFTICGGNAGPLVEKTLIAKGWRKTDDKVAFTLKWVELKQHINYKSFREGEQLVNHFPNINLLTTKIGLLESLRTYYSLYKPRVSMESFFPQTFRMDFAAEREKFTEVFDGKELWICKPTGANQGKGIFLVRDLQQVFARLEQDQKACKATAKPVARIVQKYIANPLLLHGRKFDLRVYMLVVWGREWLVFFRKGYVRLCCEKYQPGSDNLSVHLTNQYQQKKNPLYDEVKEDTVWDFKKFQDYLTEDHGLSDNWVETALTDKIIFIMTVCFKSVKYKLKHAIGFFDLLGFDFMLDTDMNVWLIEVNINPALHTNCETLARISPCVVKETLDIAIEIYDKCRRYKPLSPLKSLEHFRQFSIK